MQRADALPCVPWKIMTACVEETGKKHCETLIGKQAA